MEYASEIKSRLTMPEVLEKYGFNVRRNRLQCPFHNGQDFNCGVKEKYIHCFVCNESADVITFVEKIFNIEFSEAVKTLDRDFNLRLGIGEKLSKRQRLSLEKRSYERKKQLQAKLEERRKVIQNYWEVFDEWLRLTNALTIFKPLSPADEPCPKFIEALQKISYQEYLLDCAESEMIKIE